MTVKANTEHEQKINEILENETLSNTDKLDAIAVLFETDTFNFKKKDIASYYHDISKIFYGERDLKNAIRCLNSAIEIRRTFATENSEPLRKSLKNLGLFHRRNGNEYNSLEAYKEILNYGKDDSHAAKVYIELGIIYTRSGDFDKALNYYDRAKRFFKRTNDPRNLFLTHLQSSYTYTQMDRVVYAPDILSHLNSCDSINTVNDGEIMRGNESLSIHLRRGNLLLEQQSYLEAEHSLNMALILAKENQDNAIVAILLNSLGKLCIDTARPAKAAKQLNQALESSNSPITQAMIYNNFGDHYEVLGDLKTAETHYLKSLSLLVGNGRTNLPSVEQLGVIPNKLDALFYLNDITDFYLHTYSKSIDKGVLQKALAVLYLADNLIDIIRNESTEHLSKLFWRSQSAELYMKGVEVAYFLNNTEAAYHFMEKNKVLLLLEDITEQQAKAAADIPDALVLKELQFKEEITAAETQLLKVKSSTEQHDIKNLIFERKEALQLLRDSIETAFPKYANLKSTIEIKPFSEVSKLLLNDNNTLIEYMLDNNEGFVFVANKDRARVYRLPNITQLNQDIASLKGMISKPFYTEEEFTEFNSLASKLYEHLFKDAMLDFQLDKELLIVPDGALVTIPFEVLQFKPAHSSTQPNYLIYQSSISYCLSVSHLLQNNAVGRNPSENFLGIAPVSFQHSDLKVLNESEVEIEKVQAILGGVMLHKEDATKSIVLNELEHYAIIHIATHANYDEKQHPWLWFYDKKLSYTELVGLQSQAEMVVLSACKSLQGAFIKGEGLLSLSRGFLKSGSNSVVASLWNANDKSNREIMVSFYQRLGENLPKNKALNQAKLLYLETHYGVDTSPFYWAPSVLTGNIDPVKQQAKFPFLYLLLFVGVIGSTILFFRKK